MPIHNADVAAIFDRVADFLEIAAANPFRIRAYRNAARTIADLPQSVAGMVAAEEDLSRLPGIGHDLAEKIAEIVATGSLGMLDELTRELPAELTDLLQVAQLGPKRVAILYRQLGISNLAELAAAARGQKIRRLKGFGEKTENKILEELQWRHREQGRIKLIRAEQVAEPLLAYLAAVPGVTRAVAAGSYRRRRETVGDLDILVTCRPASPVMERMVAYEDVAAVIGRGDTKSTVRLRDGLQVDLRVVPDECYGAALHHFTGSKEHNVAVRKIAVQKGLKINEYGVFGGEDQQRRLAGASEEEVLAAIGLPFIEPELRENQGEIEAARSGRLPELIVADDIRGDLHVHTTATDGRASLGEMVAAARELGYEYLAITEHSRAIAVAHGFDRRRLEQQLDEIDQLADEYPGFRIIKGIEVDILSDGSLDLPDTVLKKLDLTVCSIHSGFNLPAARQTERMIRAMDNPHCRIIGHPTGRLINERAPYGVDMEQVMAAARERGCFLELNANPDRLDLTDHHCRLAKEMGVKVAISTDAHSVAGLANIKYGLDQARRGWLSRDDVLNTRPVAELLQLLRR
ncbi:DNA polymerase/3'-5' exonuclease PolX [Desulfurivibrio sp. C05AmB]|jgi:DNA polymerase (family X)|uniref:DNA polymerase/3'-5' exonuclease PolX n=1 Tax=Desulfurivibrio sp. C05AmB TaxID=3374371 RepID=UPI00376ECFF8